jgi:hypothetical protein
MEPIVNSLAELNRPKFHSDKLGLGNFYCNVQFYVGRGGDIQIRNLFYPSISPASLS